MPEEFASHQTEWTTLLDAARQGDSSALGEICEQVREYLLLTVQQELGGDLRSKLGASDIVQQSFLEAQQGINQFAGSSEGELRAWLKQIVVHNLVDSARQFRTTRQRDVTREMPLQWIDECRDFTSDQKTASSLIRHRETDEELLRAIAQLPQRQRRIIEMRHRDAMSYTIIAEKLAISEPAARKLWSRTVEDLRRILVTNHV